MGLIDYGQSKQLPEEARLAFARLVCAMDEGSKPDINAAVRVPTQVSHSHHVDLIHLSREPRSA